MCREEEKRLEETDSQIREKESMLLKVRETLQGYHHMRWGGMSGMGMNLKPFYLLFFSIFFLLSYTAVRWV